MLMTWLTPSENMKSRIKYALWSAATMFVSVLVIVTVINQRRLRPLGQPLAAPEKIFKIDAELPFDIADVKWVDSNGAQLLTGTLVDLRKDGDTTPLPGAILDTQVPSRAERLRELANRTAAESAVTMAAAGHHDLAVQVLTSRWSRGHKRQFIGRMTDDGRIAILASIEDDLPLDLVTAPGGKWIAFGSGEFPEDRPNDSPSFYTAFVSKDGGRTWTLDRKTTVPSSTDFYGYVSETRAYAFATRYGGEREAWTTVDGGRSWQLLDLINAVWPDNPARDHQVRDVHWGLLPAQAGNAVGWSTMSLMTVDDEGREKSRKPIEARRFELRLSGSEVAVRNVASAAAADAGLANEPSHSIRKSDSGEALFAQPEGRLRYLDSTTGNWATSTIPDIRGAASSIDTDKMWLGKDVWIVKARGDTAWNIVACYMPPYFGNTSNCGGMSAEAHFYSRDKGHSWTPFLVPHSPGEEDYRINVIGWDSRRQGLLVIRPDPDNPGRDQIDLYRLPASS